MATQIAKKKKKQTWKSKNVKKKKQIGKIPSKQIRTVRKRKLRLGRVFLVLFCVFLLGMLGKKILSFSISAIYVSGNTILSEQEIIELAKLEHYPSYFGILKNKTEATLKKNVYIKNAVIKKKKWKEVYIEIEENIPLFYDASKEKTVLKDGSEVEEIFSVPTLLNYVPDTLYELFIEKILQIEEDIYRQISEITYAPNEVDDKRFFLSMRDGNQVYVTLKTFEKINRYMDIRKEILTKYEKQTGILYLDEGEYFEVTE